MPPVVQCRDLRKTYDGKVEAVRGLNLEIHAGECFGLLGPNGAGKTTTIEILEGLLQPTSGNVTILGHTWETTRGNCGNGWESRSRRLGSPKNFPFARLLSSSQVSIVNPDRPRK
jgi:ABC-type Fe3+/spermidine/putrescine transport system ATPase subunit